MLRSHTCTLTTPLSPPSLSHIPSLPPSLSPSLVTVSVNHASEPHVFFRIIEFLTFDEARKGYCLEGMMVVVLVNICLFTSENCYHVYTYYPLVYPSNLVSIYLPS